MRTAFTLALFVAFQIGFSQTVLNINPGGGDQYVTMVGPCECPKIGDNVWANTELNTEFFRDGKRILQVSNLDDWEMMTAGRIPCFLDPKNCKDCDLQSVKFGYIYNIWAVLSPSNLAPEGWRIPNENDWEALQKYIRANHKCPYPHEPDNTCAGIALKSKSGWDDYTTGGYDDYKSCWNCQDWSELYKIQVACDVCKGHGELKFYVPLENHSGNGIDAFGLHVEPLPNIGQTYSSRTDLPSIPKCEYELGQDEANYWLLRTSVQLKNDDWELVNTSNFEYYRYKKEIIDDYAWRALLTNKNLTWTMGTQKFDGYFLRCIRE